MNALGLFTALAQVLRRRNRLLRKNEVLCYHNGERKPYFRGEIHFFTAIALASLVPASMIAIKSRNSALFMLEFFLVCKLMSYSASSLLHLFPFETAQAEHLAHQVDLFMINISILGSGIPFCRDHGFILISVICLISVAVCILYKKESFRTTFCALHGAYSLGKIFEAVGPDPLFFISMISHVAGFGLYIMKFRDKSWALPHHKIDRNGYHEDFHAFLFIADLFTFVLVMRSWYTFSSS